MGKAHHACGALFNLETRKYGGVANMCHNGGKQVIANEDTLPCVGDTYV